MLKHSKVVLKKTAIGMSRMACTVCTYALSHLPKVRNYVNTHSDLQSVLRVLIFFFFCSVTVMYSENVL